MRRGRLFHDNTEKVSVFYEDLFAEGGKAYVVQDADAVFHPVASSLTYNAGVLTQTQADADWRVILSEANTEIEKTYTLVRESDNREYEIVDILAFGGAMHLFVDEEGIS